ncbi:MAG: R3H domain-containing nucleic acid-binding protein [Myxococcota bacterium]
MPPADYEPRAAVEGETSARGELANKVITEMLERLRFKMDVIRVQDDEEEIHFDLRGDALKELIGAKGEPLLALQFLVNRMVDRGEEGGEQHIVLDAAGYRHRRRTALADLATKLAERAKEEGKVVRLSPMSAHDRRIFHITLQEIEGISTRSQGGGLYRPLLVIPEVDEHDDEDEHDEEE